MVRDYLFVDDFVAMILPMIGATTEFDLYNIGSGFGHSITEVLEAIAVVTGREPIIEERAAPATFVDRVVLDMSRYEAEFPRRELTALEDGIARLWQEIEEHRG